MEYYKNKQEIVEHYEREVELFSAQKDSQEYKDMVEVLAQVRDCDLTKYENIMNSDPTAYSWIFKNYICIKNRKGYKYPSFKLFTI